MGEVHAASLLAHIRRVADAGIVSGFRRSDLDATFAGERRLTRIRTLVKTARDIFAAIERDSQQIDRVRRFLPYYLPRAAEITEAYGLLKHSAAPDAARLTATGATIDRTRFCRCRTPRSCWRCWTGWRRRALALGASCAASGATSVGLSTGSCILCWGRPSARQHGPIFLAVFRGAQSFRAGSPWPSNGIVASLQHCPFFSLFAISG